MWKISILLLNRHRHLVDEMRSDGATFPFFAVVRKNPFIKCFYEKIYVRDPPQMC